MAKLNSKTQSSKEMISNPDIRKNTFEERHSVKQPKNINKSSEQHIKNYKLSTEPT